MIYLIIGGFWLSWAVESLIHCLNFRFWNRKANITKAIEILDISRDHWTKTAHYQKKSYYFEEVCRLIMTVAITAFIIGQGLPWLEIFALSFNDDENPSLFLSSWWFFLPCHFMLQMVDLIKTYLKEALIEPPASEDHQSSNFISNALALSFNVVVATLIFALGSLVIGSYEYWPWMLVGFFGVVVIFANWLLPLLEAHIINKKHYKTLADFSEPLAQEVEDFVKKHNLKMPNLWIDISAKATQKVGARTQGFYHAKKIVFTQKAAEEYSYQEFLTILAHELGHDSSHHKVWYFILIILGLIPLRWVLPHFSSPVLAAALGFEQSRPYITMLMLIIFGPIFNKHFITPLTNYPKRIFEYQADAYAVGIIQDTKIMSQALKRTFDQNQGLPVLHPWYSWWYKCHPALVERIRHIHKVSVKFRNSGA